jgi:membrane-associated protease RseP (regulator of RpoE activity)
MDQLEAIHSIDVINEQATARLAVEILRRDMTIESISIPKNRVHGVAVIRGRLLRPSHEVFSQWLAAFNARGYTPLLRKDQDGDGVVVQIMPGVASRGRPRAWINLILFLATVLSTLYVGASYGAEPGTPFNLLNGWPFATALLGILATHEFGHYFAARIHRVAVTLPYFIPLPFGLGTLGAFIQLREQVPDRRKLFDIGVAGPIAGLVVALPLLFWGLASSPVEVPQIGPDSVLIVEGNSLLYYYAKILVFGKSLPNALTGEDVLLSPVAFAAWIGLLVTALNLLPLGQLDGGHTVFALFGERARGINIGAMVLMALLAIAALPPVQAIFPALTNVGWFGWFVWLLLINILGGPYHPPPLDNVTELDAKRKWIGYAVILIFVLTFVPTPFRTM